MKYTIYNHAGQKLKVCYGAKEIKRFYEDHLVDTRGIYEIAPKTVSETICEIERTWGYRVERSAR